MTTLAEVITVSALEGETDPKKVICAKPINGRFAPESEAIIIEEEDPTPEGFDDFGNIEWCRGMMESFDGDTGETITYINALYEED